MQNGREGDVLEGSTEGADGDVALAKLDGDAGGAEPGSDGATIRGEEHTQQDEGAARGIKAMIGSLVRCVLITSSSPGSRSSSTLRQPIGAKFSFPEIGCQKSFTRVESISHSHKVQTDLEPVQ